MSQNTLLLLALCCTACGVQETNAAAVGGPAKARKVSSAKQSLSPAQTRPEDAARAAEQTRQAVEKP
jgi:hypothetical protein